VARRSSGSRPPTRRTCAASRRSRWAWPASGWKVSPTSLGAGPGTSVSSPRLASPRCCSPVVNANSSAAGHSRDDRRPGGRSPRPTSPGSPAPTRVQGVGTGPSASTGRCSRKATRSGRSRRPAHWLYRYSRWRGWRSVHRADSGPGHRRRGDVGATRRRRPLRGAGGTASPLGRDPRLRGRRRRDQRERLLTAVRATVPGCHPQARVSVPDLWQADLDRSAAGATTRRSVQP
jgi:hypothetical protein